MLGEGARTYRAQLASRRALTQRSLTVGPGALAVEHLAHHRRRGEEIGPGIDGLPARLLRRHVRQLALDAVAARGAVGGRLRDAEIRELHLAGAAEQHVVRRDVAVHEPSRGTVGARIRMHVIERVEQRPGHREGRRRWEPSPRDGAQEPREIASLDEFHRQEAVVAGPAELVHLHDVRVAKACGDAGFVDEALHGVGVEREPGVHPLDHEIAGDALGALQLRAKDLGHAARADAPQQAIARREPFAHARSLLDSANPHGTRFAPP